VLQVRNNPADEVFMITIPAVSRRRGSGWIDRRTDESLCLPTATFSKSRLSSSNRRGATDSLLSRHRAGDDAGFTLIELMVVLLILAILLAIAIPTFLGVTKSANDRAAQSNLDSALTNAKTIFQQNGQSYALTSTGATYVTSNGTLMASSLFAAVPNLTFTTSSVTGTSTPAAVSVAVVDNNGIALAEQAKGTNNCWYVIDNAATEAWTSSGTGLQPDAMGTWYGESKNATSCTAATIPAPNGTTIVYAQGGFPNL